MRQPKIDLHKLAQDDRRKVLMLLECADLYDEIMGRDIMPQIGGIVLQDYGKLNRAMMLGESLFGRRPQKKGTP